MRFYDEGVAPKKNLTAMQEVIAGLPKSDDMDEDEVSSGPRAVQRVWNLRRQPGDPSAPSRRLTLAMLAVFPSQVKPKKEKKKDKKKKKADAEEEAEEEPKKAKKKKKAKAEEEAEEEAPKKKKKKKDK